MNKLVFFPLKQISFRGFKYDYLLNQVKPLQTSICLTT
jgi:hypothetical protein